MNAPDEVLFWLLPCPEDEARFASIIKALAAPRGAAVFKPHLTLGAVRGDMPDVAPVLTLLRGLTLTPLEIAETDAFTMSLFVRFHPSRQLLDGRQTLESMPGFRRGRDFDPHISLCYGPPPGRADHADDIDALLHRPVVFDRLAAMHIPLPVETQDDIRKWREIRRFEIPKDS